ncbi:MAG: tetraacyldisaccharide 4'-kinase [Gammaproteobacteria bacterium HGW-Gammaproteobacteria-4]|nr:MAG: tetraacyldisaccharide 4'-kinase [Gammaproteobacteria bacterium HGW-Gammaproteobacteria-4]
MIRSTLEPWLLRRWYGGVAPGLVLRALAWLFAWQVARRTAAYRGGRRAVHRLDVPVLVVGNLVAGGSGKTPAVIALVQYLKAQGWRPGVATRGYGRRGSTPLWAVADSDPHAVGDEPVVIARRCAVPVRVDADRVRAARELVAAGCDLVLADDGLQHYRLGRDIEIEVRDAVRGYGNGLMLPAGPLREPPTRANACDFRLLTSAEHVPDLPPGSFAMRIVPGLAIGLHGGDPRALSTFSGQRVHAVAGIGRPERFFATLRAAGIDLIEHAFVDHHRFSAGDLAFDDELTVLMTEKDAVKCRRFASDRCFALAIDAELSAAFYDALSQRLSGYGRMPQ